MPVKKKAIDILDRNLVGNSHKILEIRKEIIRIAPTKLPVLLTGESGVGKEGIARLLHQLSSRADKSFVVVDMAALPDTFVGSVLFGHAKGAFTGADKDNEGLFGFADGGTLYLDNIEEASREVQRQLASFFDTQSFVPLGSTQRKHVDVRLVASTLIPPSEFDSVLTELLIHLSGFVINVPPLRDRVEDIPILIENFVKSRDYLKIKNPHFSVETIATLQQYRFPGNIRELFSIIERSVLMSDNNIITIKDLSLPEQKQEPEGVTIERLQRELNQTRRDIDILYRNTIHANPIWQGRWINHESDYCFVLMPFTDEYDLQEIYTKHVKRVAEEGLGLRCERADDIHDVSGIMQSVWESINRARFIIADLTNRNSNVFYELGIAHTLGKPVIMISQSMNYVPFDLRHLRCIVYDFKPGRIEKFEETLEKTIRTVMANSFPGPRFDRIHE